LGERAFLNNTPSVSIIMPAYNTALYIAEAIHSVLEQTYTDFELVVVDDGSTDETPQIIASIHDPRIRVIRQPNAGLSAARNTGLRESTAPLVTFLDADDRFMTDKLEVLVGYLENHPETGLVVGSERYIDQAGHTIKEAHELPVKLALPELLFENPICVSGVLLRREWLNRAGLFDEQLRACEDWDLWLRLLLAGCQISRIDHDVVAYRVHPGQMTRQSERMRTAILSMLNKTFAQPELPEFLRAYKNRAYASGLIHAAMYAYLSGECDKGQRDLAEAIRLDPTFKDHRYQRLVELLVGWSNDPRSADPTGFLQRIIENTPAGHPGLSVPLRRAIADALLAPLFGSSRETWRLRKWYLIRVILNKPEWLLNRGVVRMLVYTWLHF
jgi:glycosyltransferase involved in cell wall biosynthesis